MSRLVCSFIIAVLSLEVLADTAAASSTAGTLLQVFGALLLVIFLIFASAWSAKKLKLAGTDPLSGIRALASLPLGRKEKIVLIETNGKKLLLGVASGSVNVLHVFSDVDVFHKDLNQTEESVERSLTEDTEDKSVEKRTAQQVAQNGSNGSKSPPDFSNFLQTLMTVGRNGDK